ncbi:hypothetical protein [Streptomyces sp. WMMB 714]|uniref:hypothetical protein n=1 Tax=Streptomyces sp. WMMB 714 TaxID=1286822 RepID=UPI0005F821BF|nr:hypothetical protein [Streptomyces sp. WMMB 714]
MSENRQQAAVWLGAAASAVALLAFFDVKSFDQLAAKLDPEAAAIDACEDADRAWNERGRSFGLGLEQAHRIYSRKIMAVAKETEDIALKELLKSEGGAAAETADAYARDESLTSGAVVEGFNAEQARKKHCSALRKSD